MAGLRLRRVGRRDGSTRQVRRHASAPHVFRGTRGEKGGWRANDANRAVWLDMASRRLTRGRGGAYASRRTRRAHATRVEGAWAVSSMRVGGQGSEIPAGIGNVPGETNMRRKSQQHHFNPQKCQTAKLGNHPVESPGLPTRWGGY